MQTSPQLPHPSARPSADALAALAAEIGIAWAHEHRIALERVGRPIVDGWPGTMSEARVRLAIALSGRADRRRDAAQVAALARDAYLTARALWLAWAA